MKRKQITAICVILVAIAINACGQSSIIKRWQMAGRLENGKLSFLKTKPIDYEFLNSKKFNAYENGVIVQTGSYAMGSNGKSILLKDDGNSVSGNIIKLTPSELNIRFKGSSDTIIFYAYGSAKQASIKQNVADLKNMDKIRNELIKQCSKRTEYISSIIQWLSYGNDSQEKDPFPLLKELCYQSEQFPKSLRSKSQIDDFEYIQFQISATVPDLTEHIKTKYPNKTISSMEPNETKLLKDQMVETLPALEMAIKNYLAQLLKHAQ